MADDLIHRTVYAVADRVVDVLVSLRDAVSLSAQLREARIEIRALNCKLAALKATIRPLPVEYLAHDPDVERKRRLTPQSRLFGQTQPSKPH